MNILLAAATSIVASLFPNEHINADPSLVPLGEQCVASENMARISSSLNPPEAFIAEVTVDSGTVQLYASENRTTYSVMFAPNGLGISCLVERENPNASL